MNIASICYAGYPGSSVALHNLSRSVRRSRHFVISSAAADSPEVRFFAGYLREQRPALVIFGAWTPAYEMLLDALPPETIAAVYWSSSSGQVDISGEASRLALVLDHPRIRFKLFPHPGLAAALSARQDCLEWPLTVPAFPPPHSHRTNAIPIISLFCSPNEYRRKNILNSILAVGMLTRPYVLYLNGLSGNPDYRRLLELFQIVYRDWGWMPLGQYRRVLRRVDVGLQVSFSESFDYVAAEHIQRGIPVLGSRMVPVLHSMPARVLERCVVDNPDNPVELAVKLKYLLTHPSARQALGYSARRRLLKTNEENIRKAEKLLLEIVSR